MAQPIQDNIEQETGSTPDIIWELGEVFQLTHSELRILDHAIPIARIEAASLEQRPGERYPGYVISFLGLLPVLTGGFVAIFDKQNLEIALFCSSLGMLGLIAGAVVVLTVKPVYVLTLTANAEDFEASTFFKEEEGQETVEAINKAVAQYASARALDGIVVWDLPSEFRDLPISG